VGFDSVESDQQAFGLRHYLDVLRRRRWTVVTVIAAAIATAAAISLLQESKYRATTQIVIGQSGSLFQPGLGNDFRPFTATASTLLKSNAVARSVIADLRLTETPEQLLEKVTVSVNPETAVLGVGVVDNDPGRARRIAAALGESFSRLFNERFGRPIPTGAGQNPALPVTATIWDPAHIDPARVSPRPVRNIALAAFFGIVLGLLAGFLREHFDRGLRTREAVEQTFGVPVIGQIPFVRNRRTKPVAVWDGSGEVAEAFRALRANLQYLGVKRPLRTILVTSATPAQGKTTVTANLAISVARSGASTIAVEGDLRRPQLVEALGVSEQPEGLTSILVGGADPSEMLIEIAMEAGDNGARRTSGTAAFLPSGPLPPNPSELLSSMQMTQLLDRLAGLFDYVLIDSPPLLPVADALELARMVDGVILVVRRNRTTTDDAREVRALTDRLGIHLVGVVMTDVEPLGSYYGTYGAKRPERKSRDEPRVVDEPEPALLRADTTREEF
jgi:succinoglycan biosynthesis transport protein ExoP